MTAAAAEKGRWQVQKTKLRNLVGAGNSKIKVLGMAQVATAINGVGGMVNFEVVEELPAVLPEVIIGRNALVENPWRVIFILFIYFFF